MEAYGEIFELEASWLHPSTLGGGGGGGERGDIGKDFKKIIWEGPTILMLVEVAYGKTKKSIT